MFNPDVQILVLDFDGVLADSIAECLVVGQNAYVRHTGQGHFMSSLEDLGPERFAEGRRLRNFIRAGQDYVYIHMAIDKHVKIETQAEYDAFTQEHADLFDTFFHLFYQERQRLLDEQPAVWNSLNPLYRGIAPFLNAFVPKESLFIATTKKVEYAIEILKSNHIQLIESQIFHANKAYPKAQIVTEIAESRSKEISKVVFIDDQVDTLIKVQPTGVQCLLATWGYNNDEQRRKSLDYGIGHLSLHDFIRMNC